MVDVDSAEWALNQLLIGLMRSHSKARSGKCDGKWLEPGLWSGKGSGDLN